MVKIKCSQCGKEFETKDITKTTCSEKCYQEQQKTILENNKKMMAKGWVTSTCAKCGTELVYNCKTNCHEGCMAYKCPKCGYQNCKTPLKYYKPLISTWDKKLFTEYLHEDYEKNRGVEK